MAQAVGNRFEAQVNGVAEFGVFVTTRENRAGGLVPISMLPPDYYEFDRKSRRLVGRSAGRSFVLGDAVAVRLVEADALSGRLVFRMLDDAPAAMTEGRTRSRGPRHAERSRSGGRRRG
jgi:ribonuclease R